MTPQSPQLNRGDWRRLEMSVRDMYAKAQNDVFVITIAEYNSAAVMGSIPIPTGYWKIVLVDGQTFYYHADNVATGKVVRSNPVDIRALLWR
jgi:DNA/RNA endonuclease G (NUC1)